MSTHRYIDRICCGVLAFMLLLTFLFINAKGLGAESAPQAMGYEERLFDTGYVHSLDIVMDDWDSFISTCTNEEYSPCSVIIDGENIGNVGIRAKGNTSLTQVENYGNDRYSFKLEFDHYEEGRSYHGLDKLSLNNIIQDNTYMKDYFSYRMMEEAGAVAPLCSYVYIKVNGEDWGLYLAVEGVEESFMQRNYGGDYGELYKPESSEMGGGMGGRGDGGEFGKAFDGGLVERPEPPAGDMQGMSDMPEMPDNMQEPPQNGGGRDMGGIPGGKEFGGSGSSDVSLIYTDDESSSYQNIFDNAKTDITDQDRDRLIAALKKLNAGEDIENTVDVETVVRYFVAHNFVCNFDSYTGSIIHNYYLYESSGQLSMIPWDYNLAFGGFMGAQDAAALINYPIDTPVSGGTVDSRPMLAWIFASQEYTQLYHQYFAEFVSGYFDSGEFSQEIDRVRELISPYVEKDPTSFCTYGEFQKGAAALKDFCLLRAESVSGQLDGSIPSTSDGQAADSSALVDGSAVDISALGNMNNGFGGMGRGGFRDGQQAQAQEAAGSAEASEPPAQPEGGFDLGDQPKQGESPQDGGDSSPQDMSGFVMVGVCAAVLAIAIIAMLVYRKRA